MGTGNVNIQDNLFENITNTAISLSVGAYWGSGSATLINNIIINASNGVVSADPWDATNMDGIFMGCTNAVTDTGSLSRSIEYNDFYKNATNFIGYTSDYGTVILENRNGTPCDLLFNIYQNPHVCIGKQFHTTIGLGLHWCRYTQSSVYGYQFSAVARNQLSRLGHLWWAARCQLAAGHAAARPLLSCCQPVHP